MKKKNDIYDLTKYKLLYDNVLVKGIKLEEVEGVIAPDSYEDKPELGEVVSVGDGRIFDNGTRLEVCVKPKDVVLFNKYSTTKPLFSVKGIEYYVLREEDIVGFLR